jgi:hypothetical protein
MQGVFNDYDDNDASHWARVIHDMSWASFGISTLAAIVISWAVFSYQDFAHTMVTFWITVTLWSPFELAFKSSAYYHSAEWPGLFISYGDIGDITMYTTIRNFYIYTLVVFSVFLACCLAFLVFVFFDLKMWQRRYWTE